MKFGNYLKEHILSLWRLEYIQYDSLKMELKNRQLDHDWNQQDEIAFAQLLSNEKKKVVQFIHNFSEQLESRINYSEHLLKNTRKNNNVAISPDMSLPLEDSTVAFLNNLDDTLIEILFDIYDFSTFILLNKIGFEKIWKKHNKWTHVDYHNSGCTSEYHHDIAALETHHDHLFYRQVSALRYECRHDMYKTNQLSYKPHDIALIIPERRVKKYWVHQDHISEVIALLCMYTYIIPKSARQDIDMSNLYFDNDRLDVFNSIIKETENTRVIKCKRFGSFSKKSVFYFEDENYSSFLSGNISSKSRCKIDKNDINDFCQGNYLAPSGTDLSKDDNGVVAKATQDGIHSLSLKPKLQCNYKRLTFELPNNDDKLIITLDTDIKFHQQDSAQDFANVSDIKQQVFPFAVLEVKLSTDVEMDDSSLHWLNALTQQSRLVHNVPNFSKYIQGVHQIFLKQHFKEPTLPNFYEKEITASIQYEGLSRSASLCPLLHGKNVRSSIPYSNKTSRARCPSQEYYDSSVRSSQLNSEHTSSTLCVSSYDCTTTPGAVNVHDKHPKIVLDLNKKKTEVYSPVILDNNAIRSSSYSSYDGGYWNNNNNSSRNDSTSNVSLDQNGYPIVHQNHCQSEFFYGTSKGCDVEKGSGVTKKKKKNKVKIEPKVFFANERTFISWLQFCALLLTVALNLLNFGDNISRICGVVFLFISMFLALYALARFQYRAWQLRNPHQNGRFDDVYGPAALCILIVAALGINFWLRFWYSPDEHN